MKDVQGNRRLDDPDDFVRLEVATALARNIQVIPVLFDDVPMPRPEQLPQNMNSLYRRQFVEIDSKRFEDDVRNLAEAIKKVLPDGVIRVPPDSNYGNNQGQHAAGGHKSSLPPPPKPDNNLVWAILSTVLCCLPVGIVSIISATKVDSLWNNGQHAAAAAEAKKAKDWAIYSAIAAVVLWVIYLFAFIGSSELSQY